MKGRMQLRNRTAIVTGAAGGIGRAIAISLAGRGCNLALADVNEGGLESTAQLLASHHVQVTCHQLDVSDARSVADFPAIVQSAHPHVDVLINNAGVTIGGTFEQVNDADFEWLFGINFRGVVRMTRAFLPLLKASDDARLVNVSSAFGLLAPAGQAAYAASKFAVRGFSEALRQELASSSVGVTIVYPGGVATSIAQNARIPKGFPDEEVRQQTSAIQKMLKMPPEIAGETIVKGIERRQDYVLVGSDAHVLALIARLAPMSYGKLLRRLT
jgi:short-subunit dehydrogenase